MADSPYDVLQVKPDEGIVAIKKAYRRLVKEYHPDSGNGNADKFRKIQEAYELLSDTDKKRKYDALREALEQEESKSPPQQPGVHSVPGMPWPGGVNSGSIWSSYNVSAGSAAYSVGYGGRQGTYVYRQQTTIKISMSMIPSSIVYQALWGLQVGNTLSITPNGVLGNQGIALGLVRHITTSMNYQAYATDVDFEIVMTAPYTNDVYDALRQMGQHYLNASISVQQHGPSYTAWQP